MTPGLDIALRDIVQVPTYPFKQIGKVIAMGENGADVPSITVEFPDSKMWTGLADRVRVVRLDETNRLYRDGAY